MNSEKIQRERELFEQYKKQRAPGVNLQRIGAEYVDLDVQWHFETWLARANMFQPDSPSPCTNSDRVIDDTLVAQAEPVGEIVHWSNGGRTLKFVRMDFEAYPAGTEIYVAPPAPPAQPDAFEIARHSKRLVEQLREELAAATAERDQLRAEVEALRKDAERLDYVLNDNCMLQIVPTKDGERFLLHWPYYGEWQTEVFESPRAAIDAAMAAKEGE